MCYKMVLFFGSLEIMGEKVDNGMLGTRRRINECCGSFEKQG